jgi:glycosyltransferase involved in cell wall biosynthesis
MLSLIIPVYNEEGAVEDIVTRAHHALSNEDEIIVVDDGSTDATPGMLKKLRFSRVRILRHSHNRGNGAAIATGIHAARGEWIATIDADDTYKPEDLPRLYRRVLAEHADMIVGVREGLRHGVWHHRMARELLRKFAECFAGKPIDDINSGLRIARRAIFKRYISLYPRRFSLHIVLTVCAARDGTRILYEPIDYGPRIGVSKLSPGWRGPWNFLKFLLLIPWAVVGMRNA